MPIALTAATLVPGLVVAVGVTLLGSAASPAACGPRRTRRSACAIWQDEAGPVALPLVAGLSALALALTALSFGTLGDPGSIGARLLIALGTSGCSARSRHSPAGPCRCS